MTRPLIVACAAALLVITSAAAQHTLGKNNISAVTRSIALFRKAGKVFQNPRCLNCHPVGDRPTQTDRMDTAPALGRARHRRTRRARSCVQHLSPRGEFRRRRRTGKSGVASRSRFNGVAGTVLGRDLRANQRSGAKRRQGHGCVVKHVSEDSLVGWAWSPGGKRPPAPGTQAEFGALMRAWAASGAHCPPDNRSSNGSRGEASRPRTPVCRRHSHLRAS